VEVEADFLPEINPGSFSKFDRELLAYMLTKLAV
jgi:hypothetical protein